MRTPYKLGPLSQLFWCESPVEPFLIEVPRLVLLPSVLAWTPLGWAGFDSVGALWPAGLGVRPCAPLRAAYTGGRMTVSALSPQSSLQ